MTLDREFASVFIPKADLEDAGGVMTATHDADGITITAQRGTAIARLYLEGTMLEKERDEAVSRLAVAEKALEHIANVRNWTTFMECFGQLARIADMADVALAKIRGADA